jgi:SAM-dependent methyltransferase
MDDLSTVRTANHRAYGRIASLWDETVNDHYDFPLHERCRKRFLRGLPGRRILEIGCGLGWDSHFFSLAGYDVTATDFQEEFVALTRARNPLVNALVMDMTDPIPFPEPFHGIYSFASFLHVPLEQSEETLKRLGALLSENGVLFIHHVQSTKGFDRYIQESLLIENNPVHCYCHSEPDMRNMLMNAGFSNIRFTRFRTGKTSNLAQHNGLIPYQVISTVSR